MLWAESYRLWVRTKTTADGGCESRRICHELHELAGAFCGLELTWVIWAGQGRSFFFLLSFRSFFFGFPQQWGETSRTAPDDLCARTSTWSPQNNFCRIFTARWRSFNHLPRVAGLPTDAVQRGPVYPARSALASCTHLHDTDLASLHTKRILDYITYGTYTRGYGRRRRRYHPYPDEAAATAIPQIF